MDSYTTPLRTLFVSCFCQRSCRRMSFGGEDELPSKSAPSRTLYVMSFCTSTAFFLRTQHIRIATYPMLFVKIVNFFCTRLTFSVLAHSLLTS